MAAAANHEEIVPVALLERPDRDEARRLERDQAAVLLDPYLRRLASQEARCRHVLGTLGRTLLHRHAHEALGFARVDDYARERLGCSGRELQSMATVVAALDALPVLDVAFARGALSWTQLRLLVAVARPETEREWLTLASGRTVRVLEALIRARVAAASRETAATPSNAGGSGVSVLAVGSVRAATAALEECAEAGDVVDGEREVSVRVRCPRWVAALWREVVELACRVAGEPLATWRAAEVIAAEGLSAIPPSEAARAAPEDAAGGCSTPVPEPAVAFMETRAVFRCRASGGALGRPASALGPHADVLDRTEAALEGTDGASDHADGTSDCCDGMLDCANGALDGPDGTLDGPDDTLDGPDDTLDWSAIAEALPDDVATLARGADCCDPHTLDARLRAAARAMRRIDWQMGRLLRLFLDCRLYLLLGFPTAARYVRERLGISIRKARLLVALERKTWDSPALMDAYRAGELSSLRALTIAPVVSERHGAAWVARAGEVTLRRLGDEVAWALDVQDASVAFAWPVPPAPGAALMAPPVQMRAWQDEMPRGEIRFRGPASVVALFRSALAACREPCTPEWIGLVRLLVHVKREWDRLPRHPDPVFARDGGRCAVPACRSRRNLHDHHLVFRSRGGDNARDNRVTVCAWHHLRGIHAGRVRAWGKAPGDVRWELGTRRDGPPLARLIGDYYLPRGEEARQRGTDCTRPSFGGDFSERDGTGNP
jgi:hypothetical protein